jgi:hypothetical protein
VLDEHFCGEGDGKGGILGHIEALGVCIDDLLDARDWAEG